MQTGPRVCVRKRPRAPRVLAERWPGEGMQDRGVGGETKLCAGIGILAAAAAASYELGIICYEGPGERPQTRYQSSGTMAKGLFALVGCRSGEVGRD
jgi:hypothetical protein